MAGCPKDLEDCSRNEPYKKFHIYRGLSVETMIAIAALLAGLGSWLTVHENRLTTVENNDKHLVEKDNALENRIDKERGEMRDDIKEIKEQVNKLVDRRR